MENNNQFVNQESSELLAPLFEWRSKKKPQASPYFQVFSVIFLIATAVFLLFLQKNYFGTVAILMVLLLIFMLQQKEEEIYCAITKRGLRVKNEIFPWQNLERFYIFENLSELHFKPKKSILQKISVPINKKDSSKIKKIILQFIPEKEIQISLSEIIVRKLGL